MKREFADCTPNFCKLIYLIKSSRDYEVPNHVLLETLVGKVGTFEKNACHMMLSCGS